MRAYMHTCVHIRVYARICGHMRAYTHICVHICIHARIYIYICMNVHCCALPKSATTNKQKQSVSFSFCFILISTISRTVFVVRVAPPHLVWMGEYGLFVCLPVFFSLFLEQLIGSFTENLYPRRKQSVWKNPFYTMPAASPNTMLPHGFKKFFLKVC